MPTFSQLGKEAFLRVTHLINTLGAFRLPSFVPFRLRHFYLSSVFCFLSLLVAALPMMA